MLNLEHFRRRNALSELPSLCPGLPLSSLAQRRVWCFQPDKFGYSSSHHMEATLRKLLLPLASTLTIATPAFAQDSFDGFYAGVSAGYTVLQGRDETITFDRGSNGTFGETVTTAAGANAFSPGFCSGAASSPQNTNCREDSDGASYHFRLGYDRQMASLVVGVVGEIGKSNLRDSASAFSSTPAFYTMTRKVDLDAALRLRVGTTLGDSTLAYVAGGVAYAKLDHTFTTSNTVNAFTLLGDDNVWGWQTGAGLERRIGKKFSIGAEYLYSRYSDNNALVRVSQGSAGAMNAFVLAGGVDFKRASDRFDHHGLKVVANYRF